MSQGLVARVATLVGISPNSARRVALSAAHRYKTFSIEKRNGGRRIVAQPAREVKALQRALVEQLSGLVPVHEAAMAYRVGSSIQANAALHVSARYLLKLDFEEFFPSIDSVAVQQHLERYCRGKLTEKEIEFVIRLVLWKAPGVDRRSLCIGAPSSPLLSNSVMFNIDSLIANACNQCGVVYSRYSDDITLSSSKPDTLRAVEQMVRDVVKQASYPRLRFNDRKRVSVARNTAMTVTGLTLTNQGTVSVGRARKRGVRAGVKSFVSGRLSQEQARRLRGEVAFVLSVEPAFRQTLVNSYGPQCLELLPKVKD